MPLSAQRGGCGEAIGIREASSREQPRGVGCQAWRELNEGCGLKITIKLGFRCWRASGGEGGIRQDTAQSAREGTETLRPSPGKADLLLLLLLHLIGLGYTVQHALRHSTVAGGCRCGWGPKWQTVCHIWCLGTIGRFTA
ncbi:hypothetical protein MRB53_040291 [Persea americana]|nr:hypothetical protein MRB53_040291 [Persea americana]